jgi:lipopolysaccharide transport system ATP-binding protein
MSCSDNDPQAGTSDSNSAEGVEAITAENLGKTYRIYERPIDRLLQMLWVGRRQYGKEFHALQRVNFSVFKGETIGVIGRNGSGKSTLLQILNGTLNPTHGSVSIRGRVAALIELGAGFNPEFSGEENVFLAASVLGLSSKQIVERYQSILDFAGIGDFIKQPVKMYSSGMYARLAFGVAAHVDADILIIDEILSVGDAAFNQKCMHFIREFKRRGTILFVSHDASAITSLCDRCIWLDNGAVRAIGPAKETCELYMASLQEEVDHPARFKIGGERKQPPQRIAQSPDPRHQLIQSSAARNELTVFDFDPESQWYGRRGATIRGVYFEGEDGARHTLVQGGETTTLTIEIEAHEALEQVIVGFYVKDRLGQQLFGDNTSLTYRDRPVSAVAGAIIRARFRFVMPYLPLGDYSISPAIAEGSQERHTHHHWIDDAVFFKVATTPVPRGIVGVPMAEIRLDVD